MIAYRRVVKGGFGLMLSIMLVVGASVCYAEEGEFSIQLEPMYMDVKGNDLHVGDVFRYREEFSVDPFGNFTEHYGTSYDPINLDMGAGFTLRTEIAYRKNQWGIAASGWWFNSDDSVSGRVTTPPEVDTATGYIYYENGVRMWDHTLWPLYNELEDSFSSPVDFWAEGDLHIWTGEIFGTRTLAEKKDSYIDLAFGVKVGRLDIDREEGQMQRGYDEAYYGEAYYIIFDNLATLTSKSKADYNVMAGPMIGFQGKGKYKRIGVEGFINQSLLLGNVDQTGSFTDIDHELWIDGSTGEVIYHDVYTGRYPFSKEETFAIPVTELKLKFLVDITKNIALGAGGFASIWWDAPVAPTWSVPGDWTGGEGTGWRLQESTLIFYGAMASVNVRF
jgi:hypothetical protein